MFQPRVSARGGNDQIDAAIAGQTANFLKWAASACMSIFLAQFDRIFLRYVLQVSPNAFAYLQLGHDEGHRCHARKRVIRLEDMNQMQIGAEPFDQWQGELDRLQGSL